MNVVAANVFDALGAPVEWGLITLERAFATVGPTRAIGALGLAIIAVTLLIRLALFPIFGWQLRTMARTQAEQRTIQPQLKQLRQRYRKQPQKLSQEMQKLYQEHGINPWGGCLGCLPLLVQFPVLLALYNGIRLATGSIHHDLGFLWVGDVSRTLKDACCQSDGLVGLLLRPQLAIIPAIAVLATYVQSRMMIPPPQPGMSEAERRTADASRMMMYVGPIMVGLFSYSFYQGITLYWVTQSTFMIVQQYYVRGWGSLPVPAWLPGAGRRTPLSFPVMPARPGKERAGGKRPAPAGEGKPAGARRTAAERKPSPPDSRASGATPPGAGSRARQTARPRGGGRRRRR